MTRWHLWAIALSVLLLVAVCAGAVLSEERTRLGPFPTGDGDRIEVTP